MQFSYNTSASTFMTIHSTRTEVRSKIKREKRFLRGIGTCESSHFDLSWKSVVQAEELLAFLYSCSYANANLEPNINFTSTNLRSVRRSWALTSSRSFRTLHKTSYYLCIFLITRPVYKYFKPVTRPYRVRAMILP